MKVVILAGGLGTRISEETDLKPKPMIMIGDKPILWHIMKLYSAHGFNEFVILLGYKGYVIKEYFYNYYLHQSNVMIDLADNSLSILDSESEPFKITMIDTGKETMTGGRILRARNYIGEQDFMLTYGDGVGDVNIAELRKFHESNGKTLTVTAVQPEGRFGSLEIEGPQVKSFIEKPTGDGFWINGGFFVCKPAVFDYIREGDATIFEKSPLENLAANGELVAFRHHGFWKPMDTLRDKMVLNEMWETGKAKWKVW
ncbi:MAG: glucose-1-phosphate cytidylyltransferase [Chitinophagaceae bacterium]|nr:glucose-1-phosphate cytidylyltransferase [Chitinophagaceae bacterium]